MTTKNRLTNKQRNLLMNFLSDNEKQFESWNRDRVANMASTVLGFEVNVNHISYATNLINEWPDAPVEPEFAPPLQLQLDVANESEKYGESNATALTGRVRPWLLSDREIAIETLERMRRIETRLGKLLEHNGISLGRMHENYGDSARPTTKPAVDIDKPLPRGVLARFLS